MKNVNDYFRGKVKKIIFANLSLRVNVRDLCFSLAEKDNEIKVLKIGAKWALEKESTRIVFLEKCFFISDLLTMTEDFFE